jgi:hypothetical protein
MNKELLRQFYPRYKKHLEENTLQVFWAELSKRDFKDHCIKEKTKKISHIKRYMSDYHHKLTGCKRRLFNTLSDNTEILPLFTNEYQNTPLNAPYSFIEHNFITLKNQLIMYNNEMENELNFMQESGYQKNICPYNALNTYINILQSLLDRCALLHSLVNPLVAGICDKVFINQNSIITEPDIIGLTKNKYGFNDYILIKVMPHQDFDFNIIEKWKLTYGFSCDIIILDFNLRMDKPFTPFKVWNRADLIELCIRGEQTLIVNYKPYYFNQSEFLELIDQKKDNVDKIDLALSRINLNI